MNALYNYEEFKKLFTKYLDNSQDANTILLEITPLIYPVYLDTMLSPDRIFDTVRLTWDAAYNYGFHDAITEISPEDSLTYDDIV